MGSMHDRSHLRLDPDRDARRRRAFAGQDLESLDYATMAASFERADRERRASANRDDLARLRQAGSVLARRLLKTLAVLFSLYMLLCFPLAWYQSTLVYWTTSGDMRRDPLPKGVSVVEYDSGRPGVDHAAYVHKGDPDMPTVVYLHGRGEDLDVIMWATEPYARKGWSVVAPEYPGFAGLRGKPSEEEIGRLVRNVYEDLRRKGVDTAKLVIHGNSLGAGPALQLARYSHGFLLLTAPVGSLRDLVGDYAPLHPTFFLADAWNNVERAKQRYEAPAVVVHARDDWVVPFEHGQAVAAAAGARFEEMREGGHMIALRDDDLSYGVEGFRFR